MTLLTRRLHRPWLIGGAAAIGLWILSGAIYAQSGGDPCIGRAKTYVQINQTADAQLITGTAGQRIYICSVVLVTAGAQNLALVAGTGTVCATGIAGLTGGTTAATGFNFVANEGFVFGNGSGAVTATPDAGDNVCLLQSASSQISGVIGYRSDI